MAKYKGSAKKQTQKLAKERARRQNATARVRARESARKSKEESRSLNNAESNINESNIGWNQKMNVREMANYEIERKHREQMNIDQAQAFINKLHKNRIYIYRNNDFKTTKLNRIVNDLRYITSYSSIFIGTPIDILYIGDTPEDSYYYRLEWLFDDSEEEVSYNSFGPYTKGIVDEIYEVYKLNPIDFYRKHTEHMNEEWYRDRYFTRLSTIESMYGFFYGLPGFDEQLQAEINAQYTAPPKFEALQLKGVEGAIQQFETKTGKTVPRNTKNIIESFLMKRKPLPQYFQERNNIFRIDPSLFESP